MSPNIFKLATSELSHDSFFTWLLQWADPAQQTANLHLHQLGKGFLQLVLDKSFSNDIDQLLNIKAGRQWENIDVWAEIFCENKNILLILENKTFTFEHSNQLTRYQETGQAYCEENNFDLSCAYVKCGSETLKLINAIKEKGYKTIHRKELLDFFKNENNTHPLVMDYVTFLQDLEDSHNEYKVRTIQNWDGASWVGFYQYVESNIPVNMWHYVNNPSGGFWNLCLSWRDWYDIPVYTQIEQGKITFKVALSEDETGMSSSEIDIDSVQKFIHEELLQFAADNNYKFVERPYHFTRRGSYRAIGVIKQEEWMGDITQIIDLEKSILFLKDLNVFHDKFIDHLRTLSYEQFKRVES